MSSEQESSGAGPWSHLVRRWKDQGLGSTLARGATGSAAAHVLGALLALLAQLFLARALDVSAYGYYVYALTWALIVAQFCRLGFQTSLVRFTASYRADGDWQALNGLIRRSGEITLATSVVTGAILLLVITEFGGNLSPDQSDALRLAAITLVPLTLLGTTHGILRGYKRPAKALLPFRSFVHGGTLLLAALATATIGLKTATVAMGSTLLAAIAALVVALHWTRQVLADDLADTTPNFRTAYWLRTSAPMLLISGTDILMRQSDTVMLGLLASTDQAGLYFPAARISELAVIGLLSINAIAAPVIAEMHQRSERQRLQRVLVLAATGSTIITLCALAFFWIAGDWTLGLFGEEFRTAYTALMILLIGQALRAACGPVDLMMTMTGDQDRASMVLTASVALNIALNATLIPVYGIVGAAAATAASTTLRHICMLLVVVQRHGVNPSILACKKYLEIRSKG